MLRILVISLFVANLLLLGFQRNSPAPEIETRVVPAANVNPDVPTIHLFGEMMQDEGLLTGNRQCFSLGPFHSSKDKDEVRLLLEEVSTRIDERQTEALVEKGYWVFMPPYESLLEANKALISLQALGLEDIGIIYDGEWKNAISLGYFMRQGNAQRRKESVESKGYAPMIRVQRQGEPRFWLDYEQSPGSDLVVLDMQNRPNDFMQRALPCLVEDTVETDEADPLEPIEVVARLQLPQEDSEPASGSSVEPGTVENTANTPQEPLVSLQDQAVETGADIERADIETGTEDAGGSEPEAAVETGQVDTIETETNGAAGSGQEDTIEAEPESVIETEQQVAIESEPDGSVETGQGDAINSEPENSVETGKEDAIETEPDDSVEAGQEDVIEPELTSPVGTGPLDTINFQPESPNESEQEVDDGAEPDDSSGTGTGGG